MGQGVTVISNLTTLACIKCHGQVIERDGLDGMEQLCLNCGFGQTPNIIPTQALADDAEDYQLRNRSDGWSDTYYDLKSPNTIRRERGQLGKTNRLGTNNKPKRIDRSINRQKVTKETIDTWNRMNKELGLSSQEKD